MINLIQYSFPLVVFITVNGHGNQVQLMPPSEVDDSVT